MDEFKRAVFDAVYRAWPQRRLRLLIGILLAIKHALRGLLFSWPLYLLGAAGLALPGPYARALLLLLLPAFAVSGRILARGWREDYGERVQGRILKRPDIRRIVFGAN
jgi:hypothetical protein